MKDFLERGWVRFPACNQTRAWAEAAREAADRAIADPANAHWLQCEGTWFVGVNLLETAPSGAIGGVPLDGASLEVIRSLGLWPRAWDKAQVSVLYPGYPRPRDGESEAGFAFRRDRDAAHVDGLLPVGPERRRKAQEFHGFILGLPLSEAGAEASPMVVWEGSHHMVAEAFRAALRGIDPDHWPETDLTDVYTRVRREAFAACPRVVVHARPGEAYLVHRFALHGMAPWGPGAQAGPEGRMIAYFRPEVPREVWLNTS